MSEAIPNRTPEIAREGAIAGEKGFRMKKVAIVVVLSAFVLALAGLAGCASNNASSSSSSGSSASASASASASTSASAPASESASSSAGESSSAASESAASSSAEASSSSAEASSSAAEPESSDAAEGDQGQSIDWETVDTAKQAAEGAGCKNFDVLDTVRIGDITFEHPTFAYADRVAQAMYETGATAFYIRKADGIYGAPLSDRNYDEFAHKWTQNHKGLEINCYGPEEGAATVIQWNVGSEAFAATYQGLGGDEMTMTPDDITSIVTGIQ